MSTQFHLEPIDTLSRTNHLVDELREAVSTANETLYETRQQLDQHRRIASKVHRI